MKQIQMIQKIKEVDPDSKLTPPQFSRIVNNLEKIPHRLAIAMSMIDDSLTPLEWRNAVGERILLVFDRLSRSEDTGHMATDAKDGQALNRQAH